MTIGSSIKEETQTLSYLLRITGIRKIDLDADEIRKIVPKQKKLESFSEGRFYFVTIDVSIRDPTKARRWYSVNLSEFYDLHDLTEDFDNVPRYYATAFNLLEEVFGFSWIISKLALQISKEFEAISLGQAEAVLKKFIGRARDDEAMTSTTRTQLHRLRQKIVKYKLLVNAFEPLMFMDNPDLEEIASSMPNEYIYGQGPHFTDKGMVSSDVLSFGRGIVSDLDQKVELNKAPPMKIYGKSEEIQETRKRLTEKGLDPDWEPEVETPEKPERQFEGYRFYCQYCNHSEAYMIDKDGKIIPKSHHGHPMFLKLPRRNSDY